MWSRAWLQRRTRSCYNTLLQELRAEDIDEYKNMRMSKETFNMLLLYYTENKRLF
jgi:DNA polymerase elongation subunit (family B)